MRTMIYLTAAALNEGDVSAFVVREHGGYWLPGERRGVIETDDATVYVDLAADKTCESLGPDPEQERRIVRRLGRPWDGVLFIHFGHTYSGSRACAGQLLGRILSKLGGVVFDGNGIME